MNKKTHPKFNVPNFGARNRSRVKARWRKQRGIDSKKRIKKRFMGAEPTIGYGNPKELKGIRANGKRIVLVHNVDELNGVLQMMTRGYEGFALPDITIAKSVSIRKRIAITELAKKGNLKVTNGAYK